MIILETGHKHDTKAGWENVSCLFLLLSILYKHKKAIQHISLFRVSITRNWYSTRKTISPSFYTGQVFTTIPYIILQRKTCPVLFGRVT